MNPGTYRHVITIYTVTQSSDGQGGYTETVTSLGNFWANVNPTSVSRDFEMNQIVNTKGYTIKLPYTNKVFTEKDYCEYLGKRLQFNSIINDNNEGFETIIEAFEKA